MHGLKLEGQEQLPAPWLVYRKGATTRGKKLWKLPHFLRHVMLGSSLASRQRRR
jgi:hypothetical protein